MGMDKMATKIDVLISTMNRKDFAFFEDMNIHSDVVIVNQNKEVDNIEIHTINSYQVRLVNTTSSGLSNSRNLAIKYSEADICVLADDDMIFNTDAFEKIERAYKENPEADIIAFKMDISGNPERAKNYGKKKKWQNYFSSIAIMSGEISFRRKKIVENGINFNPHQGTGTYFYHGEENVFLYQALREGLKILYMPIETVQVDFSESSWYEGYTKKYFYVTGAKSYNMSHRYYFLLYLRFALEHYRGFKDYYNIFEAVKLMHQGKKMYTEKYGTKPTKVTLIKDKTKKLKDKKTPMIEFKEKQPK